MTVAKHFNIADLLEMVADAVPERTALVCAAQRATYRELDARASQLAHVLRSRGVRPGQHVGLYLYNCNEYLEGVLACFKLRAVPINVNYRYVREELEYMFDNADMVACIHHREFVPHIAEVHASVAARQGTRSERCPSGDVRYHRFPWTNLGQPTNAQPRVPSAPPSEETT